MMLGRERRSREQHVDSCRHDSSAGSRVRSFGGGGEKPSRVSQVHLWRCVTSTRRAGRNG
jgi:hypothetical protein